MKTLFRSSMIVFALACLLAPVAVVQAEESWEDLDKEAKRQKIMAQCKETMEQVAADNPKAKELYDKAYGWAAFDNTKVAFGFSGGGGNGVAVNKKTGEKTFMKMGTVGVGIGLGIQSYQVFFLFQDEKTFNSFVDKGWQADASAQAAAGKAAAGAQTGFQNGMALFMVTDKGIIASADVAGTKYWQNDKLNQ